MPRAKRNAGPMLVTPLVAPEDADPSAPTAQATDTLDRVGDEGSRKVSARVHRLDPVTNRLGFLDSVDGNLIDEPWIRENYGGGRYFIHFYGPMEGGGYGYLKKQNREFNIDGSIPFKGALRERQQSPAALSAPVQGGTGDGDDADMKMLFKSQLLNLIKEQNESRNTSSTMLMNMMSQQASAQQQFMALVLQLFTANKQGGGLGEMKDILGPLIAGAVNRKDPTEIAATLVGLMKPNTEMRDMFGMIREMKETADIFGPNGDRERDGDDGGPLLRMLEKSMPGLIDILKNESAKTGTPVPQLVRRPAVSSPPSLSPPAPANAALAAAAPAAASPSTPPPVSDEWTPLESYIPYLVSFASENREPYGVVQTVKTLAPGAVMANIRELVAKENALVIVLHRFPSLQPHQAWTALLLDEFYDDAFGDDGEDDADNDETPAPTDQPPIGEPAT